VCITSRVLRITLLSGLLLVNLSIIVYNRIGDAPSHYANLEFCWLYCVSVEYVFRVLLKIIPIFYHFERFGFLFELSVRFASNC
jgi:hypothetical protein